MSGVLVALLGYILFIGIRMLLGLFSSSPGAATEPRAGSPLSKLALHFSPRIEGSLTKLDSNAVTLQAVWRGRQVRKHNQSVISWIAAAKERQAVKKKGR
jgi:hypothetical protein